MYICFDDDDDDADDAADGDDDAAGGDDDAADEVKMPGFKVWVVVDIGGRVARGLRTFEYSLRRVYATWDAASRAARRLRRELRAAGVRDFVVHVRPNYE